MTRKEIMKEIEKEKVEIDKNFNETFNMKEFHERSVELWDKALKMYKENGFSQNLLDMDWENMCRRYRYR